MKLSVSTPARHTRNMMRTNRALFLEFMVTKLTESRVFLERYKRMTVAVQVDRFVFQEFLLQKKKKGKEKKNEEKE